MTSSQDRQQTKVRLLSETGRFLYRSLSQALRQRVEHGTYRSGSRIPTVVELASEFGVSTITVRRAIRDLALEGILVGRQGLGVFVANKRRIVRTISADRVAPFEESMREAGIEPGIREIDMVLVAAEDGSLPEPLASPGEAVYRLQRILLADNEPVGLDTLWLPRALGDRLKPRVRGHFVMSLLAADGIAVDHIDYQFEAATATEAQASLLNVVTGFPLLVIRFTPIGPDGLPLLLGHTTTRADRFTYEYCARPKAHRRPRRG